MAKLNDQETPGKEGTDNGVSLNVENSSPTVRYDTDTSGIEVTTTPEQDGAESIEADWEMDIENDQIVFGEEDIKLVHTRHEDVPLKDFGREVRAQLDIDNFLNDAIVLLDLEENNLENILDRVLMKIQDSRHANFDLDEAKALLCTHDQAHLLANTVQSVNVAQGLDYDQSWICGMCSIPSLKRRHVAIARLASPTNLGRTSAEVLFVILVLAPTKEKGTKNSLETGRTFSTIFSDIGFRHQLIKANNSEVFTKAIQERTKELAEEGRRIDSKSSYNDKDTGRSRFAFGRGIMSDLRRRLPYYFADYKDGVIGHKALQKLLSTTLFLYFANILPSIAMGVLNEKNTHGALDVKKVIYMQTIGGLYFAIFGGSPLVILLTTAPLALYTKIIYTISETFGVNFFAMFACVGLWNTFFLILYSCFNASFLMKFSSRNTEEIFALFISIAFTVDAIKDTVHNFHVNYYSPACGYQGHSIVTQLVNSTNLSSESTSPVQTALTVMNNSFNGSMLTEHHEELGDVCQKENSILFLLLMLGTVWLGLYIYHFTKTPFLNTSRREILADYALPIAIVVMSFFGSFIFQDIKLKPFRYNDGDVFKLAPLHTLSVGAVFGGMGLGFSLSLLFFMDQNISAAMVNTPANKLIKGPSYHWDLLIVAVLNGVLSLFGMPMMHAALPHSPLHARALADYEERVDQGHIHKIVVVARETRLTAIFAHILIGLSIFLLPYPLAYIPKPVLCGLFLYVAITALDTSEFFERIMLFVTEQSAYPPNHYIRQVPQRTIHTFTLLQLLQLAVLCALGFSGVPYLKMFFPVLIFLLLPIRHKLVPKIIPRKYLQALDGH